MVNLKKINSEYESDPNVGSPIINIFENKLLLSFILNYSKFNFKEGQTGSIRFTNCFAFRVGRPNDEGYDLNEHPVWNRSNIGSIDWNSFYEVVDTYEIDDKTFYKMESESINKEKLKHYIFFMKEATFECLAEKYEEII